jgi:hypothetical protein
MPLFQAIHIARYHAQGCVVVAQGRSAREWATPRAGSSKKAEFILLNDNIFLAKSLPKCKRLYLLQTALRRYVSQLLSGRAGV